MKKSIGLLMMLAVIASAFVWKSEQKSTFQDAVGIKFKGISLDEAKTQAKSSGKIIFIDCYTDWCGPCKKMAASSFKDPKVAALFNEKFINLKVEMEKSEDGPGLARMYGVKAYPTLLFIDANGKLKESKIGFQTAEQLVDIAKKL